QAHPRGGRHRERFAAPGGCDLQAVAALPGLSPELHGHAAVVLLALAVRDAALAAGAAAALGVRAAVGRGVAAVVAAGALVRRGALHANARGSVAEGLAGDARAVGVARARLALAAVAARRARGRAVPVVQAGHAAARPRIAHPLVAAGRRCAAD